MPNSEGLFTKVNVPADGSCLFWAIALAYLTPVKNDDALFRQRYETLFGNEETATQNLGHIRNLVQNYNTYDDIFVDLVRNTFRNRVVDHISSHEEEFRAFVEGESGLSFDNYLQDMRNPNTWGSEPEIRAMSEMLEADISVSGASNTRYTNGDIQIQLFHVGTSGVRNHYNFGLERRIVDDNEVGRLQNSLKESIKHYQTGPQDFELVQLLIQEADSLKASTSTQQRKDFESFQARFQSYIDQIPSYLHSVKKPGFFTHFFLGSFSNLLDTEIAEKLNIKKIYFSFDTSKTLKVVIVRNGQIGSAEDAINNIGLFSISEGKHGHQFTSGELEKILRENIDKSKIKDVENEIQNIKDEIQDRMKSRLVQISKEKNGVFVKTEVKEMLDSTTTSHEFHEIEKGLWNNPEGDIAKLAGSDKKAVKESLEGILGEISKVHSKCEDSLQYDSSAREAAHHGFIAGALNNFRYRCNLRVYLELFTGRGYADIVLLVRGPGRALDSIPVIMEIKVATAQEVKRLKELKELEKSRKLTGNEERERSKIKENIEARSAAALEQQARNYAKGFQPNVQRVLTTADDILYVVVNFDSPSPISNIEAVNRKGKIVPLFQDMLKSTNDWGMQRINKIKLKKQIKGNLERIYHTFPGTTEKGDNHYFSRYLLGQSVLLNEVEDLETKFEKRIFIYGEDIPTETHHDSGRRQRPAAQKAKGKLSAGLDKSHAAVSMVLIPESTEKLVYVINIVEANRKGVLNKVLPLDRLSQKIGNREIVELDLNFDTRYKSNFQRYLTVEVSDPVSLEHYNEREVDEFQGTFRKIPYPNELKEAFDRALDSQLTSAQLSSIIEEYEKLSKKIGEGILPFKTLIGKETDFQGVLYGVFSHYSDLKLQESPETRALVLTEFQTGGEERIDMVVHGLKFQGDDGKAKEYVLVGFEFKTSRQGKGAEALLEEAIKQIKEKYREGVTYKTLNDGNEVAFIAFVFNKGARDADSLILVSKEIITAKVVHSSIHVLPTVDKLDLSSCLGQGNRKKRSTSKCLFSWDDIDKFNNVENADKRNKDKIKVDDEKFLTYIKDSQDEGKNAQLVEFIGEKITPNIESNYKYLLNEVVQDGGYVNYAQNKRIKDLQNDVLQQDGGLAKNSKLKSRLINAAGRIQLIRGIHGAIVSCKDGTATDCGLNLGGIAWSFASQPIENVMVKITPKVVASAEKVVGKVIPGTLGKQTKFAIRVVGIKFGTTVAKGVAGALTGVFDIVDIGMSASNLVDCKNRENGDNLCGEKEIRDNIASISFSGASFVSGVALTAASMPVAGVVVGAGLMVGYGVYSGVSNIIEYEKKYDTTHDENWRIFWHTFAFQPMPLDVQHLAARHNIVNSLAQEAWKALSNSSSIVAYGIGLGKVSNNALHPSNAKIIMDRDNADTTSLSRVIPDSIQNAKMICLPHITDADYEKGWKKSVSTAVHYCENAMVIADIRKSMQSGKTIVYDLRSVDSGYIVGSNKLDNNFMIFQGEEKVIGGHNTVNRFAFGNSNFAGEVIVGSNSTNVFDFSVVTDDVMRVNIDYNRLESRTLYSGALQIKINDRSLIDECVSNNVNILGYHYIGRQNKVDKILCTRNSKGFANHDIMVNGGGGYSSTERDVIEDCYRVMVLPYTNIKGKEGNYIFYVKAVEYRGKDLHSEIDVRGTGTVIFPETDLLSDSNEITYSSNNNTLSLKIGLDQNNQYTLNIKNYIEQSSHKSNFILIDKNGSNIVPRIGKSESSTVKINSFELHTEYLLNDFDSVENHYKKILNNDKGYKVFGVVRDKVQSQSNSTVPHMMFGSSGDDIINFDQGTMFARGGKGHDIYAIGGDIGDRKVIIDNNSDDEKLDVLRVSEVPEEFSVQQRSLHLNYGDTHIQVKNYLQDNSYRHLIVMNSKGETFIPYMQSILHADSSSVDNGKLVPFSHATQTQNMFLLPKDFQYDRVVIDSRSEDIEQYKDKGDLLLMRESKVPFTIKIEGYFDDQGRWKDVNFHLWNNGNFSNFDLPQEIDEVMSYQDKLKADYERIVKEYVIDFTQSINIAHNQNDDLTSVGQDEERVGLIILKGITPGQVQVSSSGSDLMLHHKKSNCIINIKNWDSSESHRISALEFDSGLYPIVIRRLSRFSLSNVEEIQTLIDEASENYQNKAEYSSGTEDDLKCLVSVNGFKNKDETYKCLGFSSLQDQINFTENFCSSEQIDEFKGKISNDNQVISLSKKLQNDLLLNGYDQNTRDQCFKLTLTSELEILKLLISKAVQDGEWDEVKALLDKTANRNNADIKDKNKWSKSWTLLHYAVYNGNLNLMKGIFEFLLDKVGNINARDKWNWTPLHYAAYYNEPGMVTFLIDKNASIETESQKRETPMEVANTYSKLEVISTFINKAIEKGKSDVVENFFKSNPEKFSVEDKDEWKTNWTLLHYAAYNGRLGIVQGSFDILLEKSGSDINVKENQYGYTPLQYAVYYNRPEMVKLFLDKGADIEAKDKYGKTPLHLAAREGYVDIINLLLDNGANVEAKDQYDWTPFQYAESKSKSNVVQLFKDRYAISGENKCKPIHYAAQNDKLDLINILLNKGDDIEAKDKDGKTPLHYAAQRGYTASISLLLSKGAKINATTYNSDWSWTPLHYAVRYNKLDAVKYLVDNDANVNAKDKDGKTPLHYAAQQGCIASISLLLNRGAKIEDVLELLPDKETIINARDSKGWTPLHYAVLYGSSDMVELLMDEGADIWIEDREEKTPLKVAREHNRSEILKYLVEHKGRDGGTPLYFAAEVGDLDRAGFLLDSGANIESKNGEYQATPLHGAVANYRLDVVRLLLSRSANVNAEDKGHQTPLHYAANTDRLDIVKSLVDAGADPSATDDYGKTPLDIAKDKGHSSIAEYLEKKLNEKGEKHVQRKRRHHHGEAASGASKPSSWINDLFSWVKDSVGWLFSSRAALPGSSPTQREHTELHYAAGEGKFDQVERFVNKGADISAKNEDGMIPLDIANLYRRSKVANFLQEKQREYDSLLLDAARNGNLNQVQNLLDRGANIEAKGNNGRAVLHEAVYYNKLDLAKLLVERGADINTRNGQNETSLEAANRLGKSQIANFLREVQNRQHSRHSIEQPYNDEMDYNKATSGASRPFFWTKGSTESPALLTSGGHDSTTVTVVPEINANVVNDALTLGNFVTRLFKKTQYRQPTPDNLLLPLERLMRSDKGDIIRETILHSEHNKSKVKSAEEQQRNLENKKPESYLNNTSVQGHLTHARDLRLR